MALYDQYFAQEKRRVLLTVMHGCSHPVPEAAPAHATLISNIDEWKAQMGLYPCTPL